MFYQILVKTLYYQRYTDSHGHRDTIAEAWVKKTAQILTHIQY